MTSPHHQEPVRVSVVVPTLDRPGQLLACLEGLSRQTVPSGSFEVIVVDDGGRLPLEDVLAPLEARLRLRLVRQARSGPGSARNAGVVRATGAILAFLDDDCVPEPDWLETLDGPELARGALVGGTVTNGLPDNAFSTASHLVTTFAGAYDPARPRAEQFFTTNNLAVPRDGFEALGGFDTSIPAGTAEDKDLCDRWRSSGRELLLVPGARVSHAHELGPASFLRQHYRYGRGIVCFRLLRRRRAPAGEARGRRLRPEPWAFYARLIAFPFHEVGGWRGLWTSVLAALSQISTGLGAVHGALLDLPRVERARDA